MGKLYLGGGSGDVDTGQAGGGGTPPTPPSTIVVDVVSNIGSGKLPVADILFQSDPVAVAAGQTVIVTATADLFNTDLVVPISTSYFIFITSGPTSARGPDMSTPSVIVGDAFPLVAIAAFQGLAPGEYTFALGLVPSKTKFGLNEWQIVTQVI